MSQKFSDFEVVSQIIVVLFLKLPVLLYKLLILHLLFCQSNLLSLSTAYWIKDQLASSPALCRITASTVTYSASMTNCVADRPGVAAVGSTMTAACLQAIRGFTLNA